MKRPKITTLQWIPVESALPNEDTSLFVFCDDGSFRTGFYHQVNYPSGSRYEWQLEDHCDCVRSLPPSVVYWACQPEDFEK